ncbi:uncharacterized protein LTR77_000560 [Saxophila tyrrhenica]|uniref:Uncharacterized protein n=1 Tax=Saxophila tyrrhenica TaxID=1690608 RepID=A0AAV9PN74_9PEZI|nr:hypothetical protein LTR77_000560 [Saxophila tyrrhenica]
MAFSFIKPTRHDVYPFIDPQDGLKGAADGKTVLITGAGSGIGRRIAQSFALAGASKLILGARRVEKLEETRSIILESTTECDISIIRLDIADEVSAKELFAGLDSPPDVVVSNAAVALAQADIAASDPALVAQEIDINVKGPYLIARYYVEAVNAAETTGCLIHVSSESSWKFIPNCSTYGFSKIAGNLMIEYLQREEERGAARVRCVAMHPGGVVTELAGRELPEQIKKLLIDQPALPGGTAVYLSTERARFLSGRYVPATADMEELEKEKGRIVREDLLKTRVVGWFGSLGALVMIIWTFLSFVSTALKAHSVAPPRSCTA